jgi:small-conductance mechanosensitive channel
VVNYAVTTTHSDVKIVVATGSDVERVSAVLAGAIADDKRILSSWVRLSGVSDRGLEFTIGIDCATPTDAWKAEEQLRRRAVARLVEEKIALPDFYKSSQGVPSGSPV